MKKIALVITVFVVAAFVLLPQTSLAATKPGKVKSVKVSSVSDDAVSISWKKANKAKKYKVYQASEISGKFRCVSTVKSRRCTVDSLTAGETYYFKVRAYNGKKAGAYSKVVSVTLPEQETPPLPPQPEKTEPWYLDYSANGSSNTTRISTGQEWTTSLKNSLAQGSAGEDTIYRPRYLASDNAGNTPYRDTYFYCFDIGFNSGSYDNFLAVIVCDNEIYGWITNGNIIGTKGNTTYHWGDVASDDGVWAVCPNHSSQCSAWWPNVPDKGMLIGEVDMLTSDNEDFDTSIKNIIISEEQRFAAHLISALRNVGGSGPVESDQYLCGDGLTYGAQAMAETVAANPGVSLTHDTTKYTNGPLAGKTFTGRSTDIMDAANGRVDTTGEVLAGVSISAAESSLVYTRSGLHMNTIMDTRATKIGFGVKSGWNCMWFGKER